MPVCMSVGCWGVDFGASHVNTPAGKANAYQRALALVGVVLEQRFTPNPRASPSPAAPSAVAKCVRTELMQTARNINEAHRRSTISAVAAPSRTNRGDDAVEQQRRRRRLNMACPAIV